MPVKPNAYRCIALHPTATTTYNISDFTTTVLNNTDEYRVLVEKGTDSCDLTIKTTTQFQLLCDAQSPADPITAWLEFMRVVD